MLRPMADKIVVKLLDAPSQSEGGIHLPGTARDDYVRGTVLATGPGRLLDSGERAEMEVSVGDAVIARPMCGTPCKNQDGDELIIMTEGDILAILE